MNIKDIYVIIFLLLQQIETIYAQQKKLIVTGIKLENNYQESIGFITDSIFSNPILEVFEQSFNKKFGKSEISYNNREISVINPYLSTPGDIIESQIEFYRGRRFPEMYDYGIEMEAELTHTNIGGGFSMKIVARNSLGKVLFREKAKLKISIPDIPFSLKQLNSDNNTLYSGLPFGKVELQTLFIDCIRLIFDGAGSEEDRVYKRKLYSLHDEFIRKCKSYKLIVPNSYGFGIRKKFRIAKLPILTKSKYNQIEIINEKNQRGTLGFQEKKTGIEFGFKVSKIFSFAKTKRHFKLNSSFNFLSEPEYEVSCIFSEKNIGPFDVRHKPMTLVLSSNSGFISEFEVTEKYLDNHLTISKDLLSLRRKFHPGISIKGKYENKILLITPDPQCLNSIKILYDNQLGGRVTHAVASRKYLKRRKNVLPFFVHLIPSMSNEMEKVILQSVQFLRIAYIMRDWHDKKKNKNKNPFVKFI